MVLGMKVETWLKLNKLLRIARVIIPLIVIVAGVAGRVSTCGLGDPSGDPIPDDPTPC